MVVVVCSVTCILVGSDSCGVAIGDRGGGG